MRIFIFIFFLLISGCTGSDSGSPKGGEKRLLFLKGGGWESRADLEVFESRLESGNIAIVLSATTPGGSQGTQYFYDWYRARISRTLLPIYTASGATGDQSAESPENIETLSSAAGIIITGGDPNRLKHLVGSPLGDAIRQAYVNGIPIYANSAGLSILGPLFTWSLSGGSPSAGLGLISSPVLSHVNDFNLYCDLWSIVPSYAKQGFGISKDTIAVIEDDELRVHENSVGQVYHYQTKPRSGCVPSAIAQGEVVRIRP